MQPQNTTQNRHCLHWVVVRPEPPGQFTAQIAGVPDIRAIAASQEEAIGQVRTILKEWLASGRLVPIELGNASPWPSLPGHADPNDPNEQAYLDELARARQEDLERTLREYELEDAKCSGSSSIPTT